MIYYLSTFLRNYYSFFNFLHYTTFRLMGATLTAIILFFVLGPWYIKNANRWFKSKIRSHVPETHQKKEGTPTMGGIFILSVFIITTLIWCRLDKIEVLIFMGCVVVFGLIGLWDDLRKIKYQKGISAKQKFGAQILAATITTITWLFTCHPATTICFPFFKNLQPDMGIFFLPWAVFILVATSNAVNLMDGLDGLAIGSLIPNFATFSILMYLSGHIIFASYLNIPYTGNAELVILGAILVGISLGFLWYNTYPAQIFMGDIGSLALGSALGLMALMSKQELLLIISGGLFVLETVSVMLQVIHYKFYKKRLFKMAPIHHHFELIGWSEAKITTRFAIISVILCLITLMTLKIR